MKERPILFSAPMVRTLLAGTKTQTRRIAKLTEGGHVKEVGGHRRWHPADHNSAPACPYGQPGDRLWVREAWALDEEDNSVLYRADDNEETREWDQARAESGLSKYRWRPSIHMPRVASRIKLEIVSVHVERLQDISDADALAEGVDRTNTSIPGYAKERYRRLWETINGAGSWDANPLVWVVEFKQAPQ